MSGTVGQADSASWGAGTLGSVISDGRTARAQVDRLTEQSSSGLVAQTYGGLSAHAASVSLSVRPVLAQQQALKTGIDAVQGRMDVAQTSLKDISQIASDLRAKTNDLNGLSSSEVDSVAASARDALRQVANLLDSKDGDVYVFAGDDSTNAPVPDPDHIGTSAFGTAISSAVGGLGTTGSAATLSSTLSASTSAATSPFSASITAGTAKRPEVATGPGTRVPVGIVAGQNADVASTGTSTTGSYIRDILRSLATIGSLSGSQVGTAGFSAVVDDTRTSLGDAVTALNQDAGVLGDRQTALNTTSTELSSSVTTLTAQVSDVEQVDMTTTLSQLTAAQNHLQASYQVISSLQSLSLTKYLSGGG